MPSNVAWYGRSTAANMPLATLADGIGTFLFLLSGFSFAVMVKMYLPGVPPMAANLVTALGFAVALVALVSGWEFISGAHFNPAVTIGQTVVGKFPPLYAVFYLVAQGLGAYLALRVTRAFFGPQTELAATPALAEGKSIAAGMVMEGLITFFLVIVIILGATDARAKGSPGIPVGFTLFLAIMIGSFVTGGSANPARAVVPIVESGSWEPDTGFWVYTVAPVIGGILASLVAVMVEKAQNPSEAEGT